jgi:hypothetical protein
VFQEETEFQQGIDDVRGRRRAAGAAGASQQPSQAAMIAQQEQQAATQLKDAALLYARCLQHLLQVTAEATSIHFGAWSHSSISSTHSAAVVGVCLQVHSATLVRKVGLQAAVSNVQRLLISAVIAK